VLFLGPFFIFLGIGFALGIVYIGVRYGIPLFLGFLGLLLEAMRQFAVGFWAGLSGKTELPGREPRRESE